MRTFLIDYLAFAVVFSFLAVGAADGQETTLPTLPTADTGNVPPDASTPTSEQAPLEPAAPTTDPLPPRASIPVDPTPPTADPEPWTWQHQTQNRQGTVTNLHERTRSQDGNAYTYRHSVTRPGGSHTQLREYSPADEGYKRSRQQRFYKPDGTLLREHNMSVTGTDPYNYQRQMTHTFRDGRTMEHTFTRSYDGTTGTMERSFTGPNGQVRQWERAWTPDDVAELEPPAIDPADTPDQAAPVELAAPPETGLSTAGQGGTAPPEVVDPLASATGPEPAEESLLSRLNPFKNRGSDRATSESRGTRRSGFTIGSFGRSRRADAIPPGQARKAAALSRASQTRSMKNRLKQTGPPPRVSARLPRKAGKNR